MTDTADIEGLRQMISQELITIQDKLNNLVALQHNLEQLHENLDNISSVVNKLDRLRASKSENNDDEQIKSMESMIVSSVKDVSRLVSGLSQLMSDQGVKNGD